MVVGVTRDKQQENNPLFVPVQHTMTVVASSQRRSKGTRRSLRRDHAVEVRTGSYPAGSRTHTLLLWDRRPIYLRSVERHGARRYAEPANPSTVSTVTVSSSGSVVARTGSRLLVRSRGRVAKVWHGWYGTLTSYYQSSNKNTTTSTKQDDPLSHCTSDCVCA